MQDTRYMTIGRTPVKAHRHHFTCQICGRNLSVLAAEENQCATPTVGDIASRQVLCEDCYNDPRESANIRMSYWIVYRQDYV